MSEIEFDPAKPFKVLDDPTGDSGFDPSKPFKTLDAPESPLALRIKNETHPDISWADRAAVKNFSSSPDSALSYLKEKHPDLEITFRPKYGGGVDTSDIIVKKPGEKEFRRLDPKGFDLADITDVGYDVASGVGSTLAGAAAATGGALGTLPAGGLGAIPSAMAGSALASGGLEAARQGIGSALGMRDNIDPGQVGFAGLAGAASPALFGTGQTAAQVGKMGLLSRYAGKSAVQDSKGAISRGLEWFGPKVGSAASGIDEGVIQQAKEELPYLKDVAAQKDLLAFGQKSTKQNSSILNRKSDAWGKAIEGMVDAAEGAGVQVNVAPQMAALREMEAKLRLAVNRYPTPSRVSSLAELEGILEHPIMKNLDQHYLPLPKDAPAGTVLEIGSEYMSPKSAAALAEILADAGESSRAFGGGVKEPFGKNVPNSLKGYMVKVGKIGADLREAMIDAIPELAPAKQKYHAIMTIKRMFKNTLNDETGVKSVKAIKRLATDPERLAYVRLTDALYGTTLAKDAQTLKSIDQLFRKGMFPTSSEGTTSTSRSIGLGGLLAAAGYLGGASTGIQGGAGAGAFLGGTLGFLTGGPAAMRNVYLPAGRAQRALLKGMKAKTKVPLETFAPSNLLRTGLLSQDRERK